MPTYRLRCSYGFTDRRQGTAFGEDAIEAADDAGAVVRAQGAFEAPPGMRLTGATLTASDGRVVTTLRPPADADYSFARVGVTPFEG